MIVILDLGCQENTAVARAIRAHGGLQQIYPHDITSSELAALPNVRGVIFSGGPNRVVDGAAIDVSPEIYQCGLPLLAVCHPAAQPHTECAHLEDWPEGEDALKKYCSLLCLRNASRSPIGIWRTSLPTRWI